MKHLPKLVALLLVCAVMQGRAAEIDYVEDFTLANDRGEALKLLIPGSEQYYFYHCLHHQNLEQFDQVEELLANWIKRYKDTPRIREIQNRQALLTYRLNPEQSLESIRRRLGTQFNHQRDTVGETSNLPHELDQTLIGRERLLQSALSRHQNLAGVEDAALDWLVETRLNAERRRHLLQRLQRPDHADLARLIVADLKHRASKPFGSMTIHRQLLPEHLEECLELKSDLLNQTNFVNIYLTKLHPNADIDWQNNPQAYEKYLSRLWKFVRRLAPVHNSLKANVLYQWLVHDRWQGTYDKQRFMTYIRLPRNVRYIEPKYMKLEESRKFPADLNADFRAVTLLSPVGDDELLVQSYLHHFFVRETTTQPYELYINDVYLKHNFAETKIVQGLGEPEEWYSLLPPEKYQALKERIDLDFAPTNAKSFSTDDLVSLDVYVKHVKKLIVKVFEVNTLNFYSEQQREVNTDINLDGLVANQEQTFAYDELPLRRVRRHFEFPALNRPGVYVIDFIGNGKSSRVVIQKGKLRHLIRTSTAGHIFTVLDENNEKVNDATIWLAGHEYKPDQEGHIVVPFTSQPLRQGIVIRQGDFSSLDYFQHQSENYEFKAGIYVDRESLLNRNKTKFAVRPTLYLNGTPVTLSVLNEVKLTISSTDRDGVVTTKQVNDFKLFEDRETVYDFVTPARLAQISFRIDAKVHNLSQNKNVDLTVTDSFVLNGIDATEKIEDLHFTSIDGQYSIDLLGKTGEAKLNRPVRLSLKHRHFTEPVNVTLQTNLHGRVALGSIRDIATITATGPAGISHTWTLPRDRHSYYQSLHGVAGEPFELPYMGWQEKPTRSDFSLLEIRENTFVADRFDALSIDGRMLRVAGLPRGDYELLFKRNGQRVRLRLAKGARDESYVLGDNRHLEIRGQHPLQIDTINTGDKLIRVQLRNATKFARVHVFATRYQGSYSAFDKLSRVADSEPYLSIPEKTRNLYVSSRNIGDEYRYIIDRKYAKRYPTVMLDRPSLLLNPFVLRSTETEQQQAAKGDGLVRQAGPDATPTQRDALKQEPDGQVDNFANLDFLSEACAVLLNLVPNKNGAISISREAVGAHQHLHVVAVDPTSLAYRFVSLPEPPTDFLDLRLADGLNPKQHFTQQKKISVVAQGEQFTLSDVTTSKFESYDTLGRVHALYATLSGDPKLIEFDFVLNWPKLEPQRKRKLYSKYACHELNFFLLEKDSEFFDEVVKPYIENKKDKTFLDRWLIGDNLDEFRQSWNYERLNVVERILLSQRIDADHQFTRRDVNDRYDLLPPDVDRFNFLFQSSLQGRVLDVDANNVSDKAAEEGGAAGLRLGTMTKKLKSPSPGFTADDAAALPQNEEDTDGKQGAERRHAVTGEHAQGLEGNKNRSDDRAANKAGGRGAKTYFAEDPSRHTGVRQLYQKLDKTQEWVENNYYQLPSDGQNAELVTVNAFWRDYAQHDRQQEFHSIHFAEAAGNFTEMMFALAVLDLPFEAGEHDVQVEEGKLTLIAASPMIVFHEEIRAAQDVSRETPILVSQNFFRHDDRYRQENNEQRDKFVTDEFLVHTVYGCQVVVTNPTSAPQKLDVLVQIPVGSVPVINGKETRSVPVDLQPYHTQTIEYSFYFPAAGRYPHYPVHVGKNEQLLAHAAPFEFAVVEELSHIDRKSWGYISQNGSDEDVINFLHQNNLHRINLEKITFRMQDRDFFLKVIEQLEQRHVYNHTLWSYGIKHDHVSTVRQYLQHADEFVQTCGAQLDSPLLTINPVVRGVYQHLDYRPLVNARAHPLGHQRQILNDRLHEQYHRLLTILSYQRELDSHDLMAITYYLLLQGRIEEAASFFDRVNAVDLPTRLQYDYFAAYLKLYREDVSGARKIADRYVDLPVDRWRTLFEALDKQLDEIDGAQIEVLDPKHRGQAQGQLAASEPTYDFQVEAKQVTINYQNLQNVMVNYYLMDIELLFSRNPFVQQYSSQFSHILPNLTDVIQLPVEANSHVFTLPEQLHNANVLVEIVGGGQTKSQAYYSNSLALRVMENYGQLRVTTVNPGQPVSKVYVKVYARMKDGRLRFYKDGYTDLRGVFDYSSLNTNQLDFVDKFALLIMSDENGAVVREVSPPKR